MEMAKGKEELSSIRPHHGGESMRRSLAFPLVVGFWSRNLRNNIRNNIHTFGMYSAAAAADVDEWILLSGVSVHGSTDLPLWASRSCSGEWAARPVAGELTTL